MTKRSSVGAAFCCLAIACFVLGAGCATEATKTVENDEDVELTPPGEQMLAAQVAGPDVEDGQALMEMFLASEDPILKWEAAQTLGYWAGSSDSQLVLPALKSNDRVVRTLAQSAFTAAHPMGLAPFEWNGRVVEVKPAVLEALTELYDQKGFVDPATLLAASRDSLRSRLEGDETEGVMAADLLARLDDAGARRVLTQLVSSTNAHVLAKIAQASNRDGMNLGTILMPTIFQDGEAAKLGVMQTLVLFPDPRAKDMMIMALGDPNINIRRNAIRALGNLGAAAPVDALAQLLSDDVTSEEKVDALQALGTVGGPAVPILRRYIAAGPPSLVLEVEAIRSFAPRADRTDISWLAGKLESPNKWVRAAAATALGRIAHPAAQDFLMMAAKDPEPIVRAAIARALGRVSTVYSAKFLTTMMKDSSPLVVSMAAWGLGEAKYLDATPALKALALDKTATIPPSARLLEIFGSPRLAAIEALGRFGTDEAKTILLAALEMDDPSVRMAAAEALSTSGLASPPVEAALEKHLKDPAPLVRATALVSLKALGKTYPAGYFQTGK